MRPSLEHKILSGFGIALIILALLGYYSYVNNKSFIKSSKLITHSSKILYHMEQILNLSLDIETGQRGFALTGNETFLEPYIDAIESINAHIHDLKNLTRDEASQQKRIDTLEKLIREKQMFTKTVIELRRKNGIESAISITNSLKGKHLMDEIRKAIETMQEKENQSLAEKAENRQADNENFNFAFIGLLICITLVLILVFLTIQYNLKALKKAAVEIEDLYNNAPCGYHSLNEEGIFVGINNTELEWLGYTRENILGKLKFTDVITAASAEVMHHSFPVFKKEGKIKDMEFDMVRKDGTIFPVILNSTAIYNKDGKYIKSRTSIFDNTERKLAESRIKELNADLESNVAKLEAANNELESFSYSVSHDLRAPLRSIAGYAQILQEDYGDKLDGEGEKTITTIVNNAQRMGQLIDDLLSFSKFGRTEMVKSKLKMDTLVESIIYELKNEVPERKIEVKLQSLEPCTVDATMIKQVWINLLSNAFKYTRLKEVSAIEIGGYTEAGENIYYVKDNGVGFDMQYVHKLFGVFQRLHKPKDFEGTGVGLAIVQRIIKRHEGYVWAQGAVNKGATFFFSLPKC